MLSCWLPASAAESELAQHTSSQRPDLSAEDRARVARVTQPTTDFNQAESFELMQGGAGTSKKLVNRHAFSQPSANLSFEEQQNFFIGNGLFRKLWVSSPSSTHASDGLGPLFNARSCQSCHVKDGRGRPPSADGNSISMFLRLAHTPESPANPLNIDIGNVKQLTGAQIAAISSHLQRSRPDPIYGHQLQDLAVPGLASEGQMRIAYSDKLVTYPDGNTATLRAPSYSVDNLAYGDLHAETSLSPRIANQMIGLGLVEAIHPNDILALADPEDADGDGISGRPAWAIDNATGALELGRFGWKAQNPNVEQQSAEAFAGDIGISSPRMPSAYGDCTEQQAECLSFPNGVQKHLGATEAPDPVLELVSFYSRNLAVPARRDVDDAEVLRGKEAFYASGCTGCHTPKFVTRRDTPHQAQAFQLIWPYSDFLLHDMGEGLADNQSVGVANGREWRTPPLWGIGLTETVSDHTFFLHDGRARNLTEAILWHGGEAEAAQLRFTELDASDRAALIKFLESL